MKEIKTEIEINASASKVWQILMDFNAFSEWNPFIKSIEGEAKKGNRLKVRIEPPDSSGATFSAEVKVVEPMQKFSWLGSLGIPGIFDGEHVFEIKSISSTTVLFIHRESFRGLLIPLLQNNLMSAEKGFKLMNQALKKKAESNK